MPSSFIWQACSFYSYQQVAKQTFSIGKLTPIPNPQSYDGMGWDGMRKAWKTLTPLLKSIKNGYEKLGKRI